MYKQYILILYHIAFVKKNKILTLNAYIEMKTLKHFLNYNAIVYLSLIKMKIYSEAGCPIDRCMMYMHILLQLKLNALI